MITVVMLCHRRFDNLETVIESWLGQAEVSEFILCDNSGTQWSTELPIVILNSNVNYGTYIRYAAPLLAKNDLILWADDDIVALPDLAHNLLSIYDWSEAHMVGIMGKQFTAPLYYESTGIRGKNISNPTRVDYLCGNCLLTHRKHFVGVDMMADMPKYYWEGEQFLAMGDWWWEHWLATEYYSEPFIMLVAPTDKYEELPEQKDGGAYHKQLGLQLVREYYFRKWILGLDENINEVDKRLSSTP